ncbi:hypothetical protein D3C81_2130700 [compost metagenome]
MLHLDGGDQALACFFGLPMKGSIDPVPQWKHYGEVLGLHQVTAVMQFMQPPHVANPRQATDRILRREVLAGMKDLVAEITAQ